MSHFLQYFKPDQADMLEGKPLTHAASGQYGKRGLREGDVIWIVFIRNDRLRLLGRLVVDDVVGQREAERLLHTKNLYEAAFHAIAERNSIHEVHGQDIQHLAARLRFNSPKDRLKTPQRVDGKQLQSLRELTPASAELLTSAYIRSVETLLHDAVGSPEELEFPEGALKYRQHVSRERNRDLVQRAKQRYKQKHGKIDCEICGFDFYEVYGERGEDFIECHHTLFVSELGPNSKTRIDDVVLLCPNCHRIVHRHRPWLRVSELRSILRTKHPGG